MDSLQEFDAAINEVEAKLRELNDARDAWLLSRSDFKIGDLIKFGSKRTEGKVVALHVGSVSVTPVVTIRKKGGEFGIRRVRLYSWDKPEIIPTADQAA